MRHVSKCETLNVLLLASLISSLIFAPLFQDISLAQSKDVDPPYISHHPARIAIQGKPVNVVAHIFDDSQIASVTIAITRDGQTVTGKLPKRKTAGPVPVVAKAMGEIPIFTKASPSSKVKGSLAQNDAVNVTRVSGQYYRVRTPMGVSGYVKASDCQVVVDGAMYAVAIPASMTSAADLSYQIAATDIYGNVEKGEVVQVNILDQNDLLALRSGTPPQTLQKKKNTRDKKGGIGMGKIAFFTGVALAGGGAYYLYSQNKKSDEDGNATVDLVLSWD